MEVNHTDFYFAVSNVIQGELIGLLKPEETVYSKQIKTGALLKWNSILIETYRGYSLGAFEGTVEDVR